METNQLKSLISQGNIQDTINLLMGFVEEYYARFVTDVLQLSSRYHQIEREKNAGTIPAGDYKIEINSITRSLIEIISSIEGLGSDNFKKKKSREDVKKEILEINDRYESSRKKAKTIQTTPTRLREKNEIVRKLGEIFINHPEFINDFSETSAEGIIAGIANRYKIVPDTTGIDFFERVAASLTGDFTRACIANALAEIIYTGQIRFGDDVRIYYILDTISVDADEPLLKNIERVKADLDYFLGRLDPENYAN